MIDLQILGTFPRPGRWNWSFGTWFYRKLSRSPRDKKIKHLVKYIWRIFFKLAHYFFSFSECNPISDIHLKHTDHCFQFFSNKIWSITNITRMPLMKKMQCLCKTDYCPVLEFNLLPQQMWQLTVKDSKTLKRQIF